jgi:hypothetical protein
MRQIRAYMAILASAVFVGVSAAQVQITCNSYVPGFLSTKCEDTASPCTEIPKCFFPGQRCDFCTGTGLFHKECQSFQANVQCYEGNNCYGDYGCGFQQQATCYENGPDLYCHPTSVLFISCLRNNCEVVPDPPQ